MFDDIMALLRPLFDAGSLEAMFGVHSGVFGPSSEPGYLDVLHAMLFAAVLAAMAFGLVSLIAASVGGVYKPSGHHP